MHEHEMDRAGMVRSLLAAIALGAATSGAAMAQDAGTTNDDVPLLTGPKVEDTHAPGSDTRFGEGMQAPREMERPVPLRIYEQELRKLGAPDAPEDVRLSDEQSREIRGILDGHRRALRAFYVEHREQLLQLRRDAGVQAPTDRRGPDAARPGRGDDQNPEDPPRRRGADAGRGAGDDAGSDAPAMDAPADRPLDRGAPSGEQDPEAVKTRDAARRKLAALRAQRPDDSVAIKRIWGVLNDAQRAHVEGGIEAFRAETMRRREMQKLGDRDGASKPGDAKPGDARPGDARPGAGASELDRLPERVRERLAAMSPEERERALERLRQRRGAARDAGGARRPKAPPSVDEIDLPETDD